jgi:tetratricopeptide (TPR) repeat protein
VADFGFDAYALDGDDAGGHSHPLEIARDLIATGKPRSALEVLGMHQAELVDDPAYLLICSEAWWAAGDTLRAQEALLGAARLAPEDPTPLQLLGELLHERGEHDKAARVIAKARALGSSAAIADDFRDSELPGVEDDLIAFAELQERRTRAGLTPKQIAAGSMALLLVAGAVVGIALLTRPRVEAPAPVPASASAPASASVPASVPASASLFHGGSVPRGSPISGPSHDRTSASSATSQARVPIGPSS